jgi:tetratricopeptide (TPR) repeat protein
LSGDENGVRKLHQDVAPHRDGYVAGNDMHLHFHERPAAPSSPIPAPVSASAQPSPSGPVHIWGGVPARNPAFTGREELLGAVRDGLVSRDPVPVQVMRGLGGVGKTQIAIEYAHRHADAYDVVWWLNAENAALLGEQFAALAGELGCSDPAAALDAVQRAVLGELHRRSRWLLIFDNAEEPADVRGWLPGGAGHVLITSRSYGWEEVAVAVEVDVFNRAESAAILCRRVMGLSEHDAGSVADAVGDLPLAVAQAAGYLAETRMPTKQYVGLLQTRAAELLDEGRPPSYPATLAAVTRLAFDRLRGEDQDAADVAAICAFLAPAPVPADWFSNAATELPTALSTRLADPVTWSQLLTRLTRSSLARLDQHGVLMHALTQAILRAHLPVHQGGRIRSLAEKVLAASNPGDPELPDDWPGWARVLPHLLFLDPSVSDSQELRSLAVDTAWYLTQRADAHGAYEIARQLYERWRERLGPDDESTLRAANALAEALRAMGRYAQSRQLDEDTLARRRGVLGENHPDTLTCASNLAMDLAGLGEYGAAGALDEDTLARRRRMLGEDHSDTLISASGLAYSLRKLGKYQAARELDEDILSRSRRVRGGDHPRTLAFANDLARDLYGLGEYEAARDLDEDILAQRRRVLGEDHPETHRSVRNLAKDLRALGAPEPGSE